LVVMTDPILLRVLEFEDLRVLSPHEVQRDKDGLLPSKRNTICVLDHKRESKPPRPTLNWKNRKST